MLIIRPFLHAVSLKAFALSHHVSGGSRKQAVLPARPSPVCLDPSMPLESIQSFRETVGAMSFQSFHLNLLVGSLPRLFVLGPCFLCPVFVESLCPRGCRASRRR